MRLVSYLRVSTAQQGRSGLGLEAQRQAINAFLAQRKATELASFTEVESGKSNARPELGKALALAKATGATLVIAKLDRLSRNAAFLLSLRDSGVRFVATDMPEANELTIGVMALVAQQEREAISKRTKEALAAAKARGRKLGNPNGAAPLRRAGKGNEAAVQAVAQGTAQRDEGLRPFVRQMQAEGCQTLQCLADALNAQGFKTARGGSWHKSTVRLLLERLEAKKVAQIDGSGSNF